MFSRVISSSLISMILCSGGLSYSADNSVIPFEDNSVSGNILDQENKPGISEKIHHQQLQAKIDLVDKYFLVKGRKLDCKEIFELFEEAAVAGLAQGQFKLGLCYRNGFGVDKSWKSAVYWFKKAARQGSAGAMYALGRYYEGSPGLMDQSLAKWWYGKAIEHGHKAAQFQLEILLRRSGSD